VRPAFDAFNTFFFARSIKGAEFTWQKPLPSTPPNLLGHCHPYNDEDGNTKVMININPERVGADTKLSNFDYVMDVLLHEMLHAYLRLFACDGTACASRECFRLAESNIGSTRHGRAWMQLATAIAQHAKDVFGINVHLGTRPSLQLEIERSRRHPVLHELKEYFGQEAKRAAACRQYGAQGAGAPSNEINGVDGRPQA